MYKYIYKPIEETLYSFRQKEKKIETSKQAENMVGELPIELQSLKICSNYNNLVRKL